MINSGGSSPCNVDFHASHDDHNKGSTSETYYHPFHSLSSSPVIIHPAPGHHWQEVNKNDGGDVGGGEGNSVHEFELVGIGGNAEVLPASPSSWGAAAGAGGDDESAGAGGFYVEANGDDEYSVDFEAFARPQKRNHKQHVFNGARMVRKAAAAGETFEFQLTLSYMLITDVENRVVRIGQSYLFEGF
jgi:hypothetical protein